MIASDNTMTLVSAASTDHAAESGDIYARRRAQLRLLVDHRTAGNVAAFADQFGYSRSRVSQFLSETYNEGRSIGERAARALEEAAGLTIGWLDASATVPAHACTDHAAELRGAIAQTRIVFESAPAAGRALDYLHQVLDTGHPATAAWLQGAADAAPTQRTRMLEVAAELATAKDQVARLSARNAEEFSRNLKLTEENCVLTECVCALEKQALSLFGQVAPAGADVATAPATEQAAQAPTTSTFKIDIDANAITAAVAQVKQLELALDNAATVMVPLLMERFKQLASDIAPIMASLAHAGDQATSAPLTAQQVDKIENRMIASLAEPLTGAQREAMRVGLVAGFRTLNAMGVQPAGALHALTVSVSDLGPAETRHFPAFEVLAAAPQSAPLPEVPA